MKIQVHANRIKLFNTVKHLFVYVLTSCNSGDVINSNYLYHFTFIVHKDMSGWWGFIICYMPVFYSVIVFFWKIKNSSISKYVCQPLDVICQNLAVGYWYTISIRLQGRVLLVLPPPPLAVCFCSTRITFNLFISFLPIVQLLCI